MMLLMKDCGVGFSHLSALAVAHTRASPVRQIGVTSGGWQQGACIMLPSLLGSPPVLMSLCKGGESKPMVVSQSTQTILLALALILKPGHTLPSLLQQDFSRCLRLSTCLSLFLGYKGVQAKRMVGNS